MLVLRRWERKISCVNSQHNKGRAFLVELSYHTKFTERRLPCEPFYYWFSPSSAH